MKPNISYVTFLFLIFISVIYSTEMKYLNIAVIWNDNTYSTQAPYGWQVGSTTKGEATHAPEIGKAQLKRVLNAIDPTITIDPSNSTLDTSGIPDELRNSDGIPNGPFQGKLRNVLIYKASSRLAFSDILNDLDGRSLSSIVYINSGAIIMNLEMYTVLNDAINKEVGIVFVGSESANEAQFIDTTFRLLPFTGIQKEFTLKGYLNDKVLGFDFLENTNSPMKDTADSVVLVGNVDFLDELKSVYKIVDLRSGDTIFHKMGSNVVKNNTIYPNDNFLTKYGEWVFKARALEPIGMDLYTPEMASGINNCHYVILVGKIDGVYVAKAIWGAPLMANNTIIANRGEKVEGIAGVWNESEGYFEVTEDFIFSCPNNDNVSVMDSIRVIKAGEKIKAAILDTVYDLNGGTYLNTYLAGGYTNLNINFKNVNKTVFNKVFPTLDSLGVSSLKFKPWTKGGRIQADADIWAFNQNLNLSSFKPLYDKTVQFDTSTYYCDYLGNQVAGKKGSKQFIRPAEKLSDFDLPYDSLTIDSIGYDTTGKQYHAIAVMQKNHLRVAMLGFQPSYLEDEIATQYLLHDIISWVSISINDHSLPTPKIYPKDSSSVKPGFDSLFVIMDFFQKSDDVRKEGYDLLTEISTTGGRYYDTISIAADNGTTVIDSFVILFSELGIDNGEFKKGNIIEISIKAKPSLIDSYVHESHSKSILVVDSSVSIGNKGCDSFLNKNDVTISLGRNQIKIDLLKFNTNEQVELQLFNLAGKKIGTLYKGKLQNIPYSLSSKKTISKGTLLVVLKGKSFKKILKLINM